MCQCFNQNKSSSEVEKWFANDNGWIGHMTHLELMQIFAYHDMNEYIKFVNSQNHHATMYVMDKYELEDALEFLAAAITC